MLRRWRCRHQTGIGKPHAFHYVLAKPGTLNRIFRMPRVWRDAPCTKKVFTAALSCVVSRLGVYFQHSRSTFNYDDDHSCTGPIRYCSARSRY